MKDAGHILRVNVAERRRRRKSHPTPNDWKRPGSGSLQISLGRRGKFLLPVNVLLPGKMFCTDPFDFYGMRQWISKDFSVRTDPELRFWLNISLPLTPLDRTSGYVADRVRLREVQGCWTRITFIYQYQTNGSQVDELENTLVRFSE